MWTLVFITILFDSHVYVGQYLLFPTLNFRLNGGTWSHLKALSFSVCLFVCVSVCTALLKKVVPPSDCKITKWISLAQDLLGWINFKPPYGSLRILKTLPSGMALFDMATDGDPGGAQGVVSRQYQDAVTRNGCRSLTRRRQDSRW